MLGRKEEVSRTSCIQGTPGRKPNTYYSTSFRTIPSGRRNTPAFNLDQATKFPDLANRLAMFPYGPGYARFVKHCLPALLGENVQWPRLKSIRLYGFDIPPEGAEKYSFSQSLGWTRPDRV
jgi:hypothetical protein